MAILIVLLFILYFVLKRIKKFSKIEKQGNVVHVSSTENTLGEVVESNMLTQNDKQIGIELQRNEIDINQITKGKISVNEFMTNNGEIPALHDAQENQKEGILTS